MSADDQDLPGMLAVAKGVAEQRWPHTTDAKIWADEFVKLNPGADHGLMLGWFANAIMAGYDTAQARATRSEKTRMIEDPDGVERDGNGRSAPTDKKSSLIARLREEANVTIHNIDDQEIACCPMWTKGVLDDLAKLMNEAADALSASSAGEGRETMLLALIELVRNHPEFDQGGPMADAMDQALRGETPKLLVDAAYLREGRKPPTDTRSATTSIMDRVRLLEALLSEAVRLLKLDGVIFDPTDCIKQSERALKASTPDRNVSE